MMFWKFELLRKLKINRLPNGARYTHSLKHTYNRCTQTHTNCKKKFNLYLFYNDYLTSYTTYINHARWHRCLLSDGLLYITTNLNTHSLDILKHTNHSIDIHSLKHTYNRYTQTHTNCSI